MAIVITFYQLIPLISWDEHILIYLEINPESH